MTAAQLVALANAIRARVRRDECGDAIITGKRGSVHADGTGLSVYVTFKHGSTLARVIEGLKTRGVVQQRGDTEIVFFVQNRAFDPAFCAWLRALLKIPRRRVLSEAQRVRLAAVGFKRAVVTADRGNA